jgi:hypothetical protein
MNSSPLHCRMVLITVLMTWRSDVRACTFSRELEHRDTETPTPVNADACDLSNALTVLFVAMGILAGFFLCCAVYGTVRCCCLFRTREPNPTSKQTVLGTSSKAACLEEGDTVALRCSRAR